MKLLSLLLVVMLVVGMVTACLGDKPDDEPGDDPGVKPGDDPNPPNPIVGSVDVSRVEFKAYTRDGIRFNKSTKTYSIDYDGKAHMLSPSYINGTPTPLYAECTFEYYLNDTLVAAYDEDGKWLKGADRDKNADGLVDAGTYTVKVRYTYEQHNDGVLEGTFIIAQSYNINYALSPLTGVTEDDMVVSTQNPTNFSDSSTELSLYSPSLDIEGRGYKFAGWYLNADGTGDAIATIDGSNAALIAALQNGSLTLYAKFFACVAYPQPFVDSTITTPLTQAPAGFSSTGAAPLGSQLPAIPGFDLLPEDKAVLLDMELMKDTAGALGYGYSAIVKDKPYFITKSPAVQTAGGQYAMQWQDPSNTWDFIIDPAGSGDGNKHVANDDYAGASMMFSNPLKNFNYEKYDTLEFWIYNGNASESVFTMVAFVDGVNNRNMYYDIKLDFTGWKKFVIHVDDFTTDTGSRTMNITMLNFYSKDTDGKGGVPADNATLYDNKNENFIFFSNFYVTHHGTNYDVNTKTSSAELVAVLENLAAMNVNATKSDAEITSIMAGTLLGSTPTSADIKAAYQNIYYVAEAWNDPDSAHYNKDTVLNYIADSLNTLSEGAADLVNAKVAVDDNYVEAAYYLVKSMNTISKYIDTTHAQAWMAPVLYFVPAPVDVGNDIVRTGYIFACANAALGNTRGFLTGVRAIASAMAENRITLAVNTNDVVDGMQLFRALNETAFGSVDAMTDLTGDVFAWFYNNIDVFLVNGTVPTQISTRTDYVSFETYLRGMLLIYDVAPEAEQNKFAAAMKDYMAKNASLKATLTSSAYFKAEAENLAKIEANTATAAAPSTETNVIRAWESIGQAYYRTEAGFILIDRFGTAVNTRGSGSVTPFTSDKIYCLVANDILTVVVAGNRSISISATAVQTGYFAGGTQTTQTIGSTTITVSTAENATFGANTAKGTPASTAGAPMIVSSTVTDQGIDLVVYNFTDAETTLSVMMNGTYSLASADSLFDAQAGSGKTQVTVKLQRPAQEQDPTTGNALPTKRVTGDSVFTIKLK